MDFNVYIKPELLVLIPVLFVIGKMIKGSKTVQNRFIPVILGCTGVGLSILYVVATEGVSALGFFTAITQGILVAGASVYANELKKNTEKKD